MNLREAATEALQELKSVLEGGKPDSHTDFAMQSLASALAEREPLSADAIDDAWASEYHAYHHGTEPKICRSSVFAVARAIEKAHGIIPMEDE